MRWVARTARAEIAMGGENRTRGECGRWREPHAPRLRSVARTARAEIAVGGENRTRRDCDGWREPHAPRLRWEAGARRFWLRWPGVAWGRAVLVAAAGVATGLKIVAAGRRR